MLSNYSLEELKDKLNIWRKGKVKGKEVPLEYKNRAVELLSEHKVNEIQRELNLSSKTFNRWRDSYSVVSCSKDFFVSLPLPDVLEDVCEAKENYAVKNLLLKLSRHTISGEVFTLEGNLSVKEWKCAFGLLGEIKC